MFLSLVQCTENQEGDNQSAVLAALHLPGVRLPEGRPASTPGMTSGLPVCALAQSLQQMLR